MRVIAVRGELDLNTAPQLEKSVDGALTAGSAALAIDLSGCEFIDSTGIALIVRAWQQLDGDGKRRFALCGLSHQVQRLFSITGLEASIPIHSTLDEAVADLAG